MAAEEESPGGRAAQSAVNSPLQKSIFAACSKNLLARRGKKSRLKRI
jgi:hypothetical protein